MTLYFLDTEFIEDGHTIDLVSLGMVAEDGREFYAENVEADLSKASDWVKANVLPHLIGERFLAPRAPIAAELRSYVAQGDSPPEFWSWCAAYDWVAICQLYGPMIAKPDGWPNYCRDLQQELDRFGIADDELPPHPGTAHDALADALWHRDIYRWITGHARSNMARHARRELDLLGEEPAVIDWYCRVIDEFASFGHSGGSAAATIPVLERLLRQEALTLLTDDPDEWIDRSEASSYPLWQNRRDGRAFSDDGGETHWWLHEREAAGSVETTPIHTSVPGTEAGQRALEASDAG